MKNHMSFKTHFCTLNRHCTKIWTCGNEIAKKMGVQKWSQIFHTIKIAKVRSNFKILSLSKFSWKIDFFADFQENFDSDRILIILLTFAIFIVSKIWDNFWTAIFCTVSFPQVQFFVKWFFDVQKLVLKFMWLIFSKTLNKSIDESSEFPYIL